MMITSIKPSALSATLANRWSNLRARSPEFTSPFFAPEFTMAVGRHRADVEIAIIETDDHVVGFFPFQRTVRGGAVPVANRLNDFHGLVLQPGCELEGERLLRDLSLQYWRFHHQIPSQELFAPSFFAQHSSPYVDLSDGFPAYDRRQRAAHSRTFKDQRRRLQQLETHSLQSRRGPLRFEFDIPQSGLLDRLIQWKRLQYQRTNQPDVFGCDWTRALLHDLLSRQHEAFKGVLSVLFAGDQPIAMHFGLRSRNCLHGWFPAYDVEFARWSPGLQLWIKLIESAEQQGITRIDLGSGGEAFKDRVANAATMVAEGVASRYRWHNLCQQTLHRTSGWLSGSPLKRPLKRMAGGLVTAWRHREFRE